MKEKFFPCLANEFDCPYYDANGNCMMYPEFDPVAECDDCIPLEDDDYDT